MKMFREGGTYDNNYTLSLLNRAVAQEMVADEVLLGQENKAGGDMQNGQVQHASHG